jgi:hypothetical protein
VEDQVKDQAGPSLKRQHGDSGSSKSVEVPAAKRLQTMTMVMQQKQNKLRLEKMEKNKDAAQSYRQRKKEQLILMQERIDQVEADNQALRTRFSAVGMGLPTSTPSLFAAVGLLGRGRTVFMGGPAQFALYFDARLCITACPNSYLELYGIAAPMTILSLAHGMSPKELKNLVDAVQFATTSGSPRVICATRFGNNGTNIQVQLVVYPPDARSGGNIFFASEIAAGYVLVTE